MKNKLIFKNVKYLSLHALIVLIAFSGCDNSTAQQNKKKITILPNLMSLIKFLQKNNYETNVIDLIQKSKLKGDEKKENLINLDYNFLLWKKNILNY